MHQKYQFVGYLDRMRYVFSLPDCQAVHTIDSIDMQHQQDDATFLPRFLNDPDIKICVAVAGISCFAAPKKFIIFPNVDAKLWMERMNTHLFNFFKKYA